MNYGRVKMRRNDKKRHSLRMRMLGMNISITMISFILYGFLFVMSINFLIGKYINNDLDFFLTEVSNNLEIRVEYVKDTISKIRSSQDVMSYLENGTDTFEKEQITEQFMELVNINSSQNKGKDGEPTVEKVYLFTQNGEVISDFYYALLSSEIDEANRVIQNVRSVYRETRNNKKGFSNYYYKSDNCLYLACPVLDEQMEEQGEVIFEINLESLKNIMKDVDYYENAFWMIRAEDSVIIQKSAGDIEVPNEVLKNMGHSEPVTASIEGKEYRLYNQDLCLGVSVSLGIPEDYAIRILYDSIDIYVIGILTILAAGLISFGIFTYKMTRPIEEVREKLKQVQGGDFETKLPDYDNKEFHEISKGFNQMTTEINYLINEVYQKQILEKEMELKFLQSQMNPHFMFNVLNAISLQAKIDGNEQISRHISTFSQLIQSRIYRSDTEKVKIKQELEYAKYYLEIQKFRYGERLSYSIDAEERLLEYYIPKLCIQMVAENAVVHGIEPKMGAGNVQIRIFEDSGNIMIRVIDNGVGFNTTGEVNLPLKEEPVSQHHNRVGLNNVNNIIKLMFGKEFGITIFSEEGNGTTVTICIPFDRKEEKE